MSEGDVLVGDAIYENYWTLTELQRIGCDGVFELNGTRCMPRKHRTLVELKRPSRPGWMDTDTYPSIPKQITVRATISRKKGYRDKTLISTFTDENVVDDTEIVALYDTHWSIETDFRSLKCDVHTDILRCRTPDMVVRQMWIHLLAYDLIRLLMCEAATAAGREPRTISFRHTVQLCTAWWATGGDLDE